MDPVATTRSHQRSAQPGSAWPADEPTTPEWPILLGRMLEDLSRVIQLEFQLLGASIAPSLIATADRAIAGLAMLFAGVMGGICLLAALILLLHERMQWWQSLAIGGFVAIACGAVAYSSMKRPSAVTETKTG